MSKEKTEQLLETSGWICLHRKLLSNAISDKADYLAVWVHLLLMASHKPTYFIWNNKKQTLNPGQLLTGRKKLSRKTGVAESQVYKILEYLELEQQIEQQKTTKFTIITIVNWGTYQDKEQQKEQQSNNRINNNYITNRKNAKNVTTKDGKETLVGYMKYDRGGQESNNRVTTEEQQSNTYNNDNNVNNINKGSPEDKATSVGYKSFIEAFNKIVKSSFRGDTKSRRSYIARMKDYTPEEVLKAVEAASRDAYLMGENPGQKRYLTPEYILREDKLEKWLNSEKRVEVKILNQK